MPSNSYMPNTDNDKAELLEYLVLTLPQCATLLEISDQTLATLTTDSSNFRYTLGGSGMTQACSQSWTSFKKQLRDGGTDSNE
jgi:hypothetical protein